MRRGLRADLARLKARVPARRDVLSVPELDADTMNAVVAVLYEELDTGCAPPTLHQRRLAARAGLTRASRVELDRALEDSRRGLPLA